MTDLPDPGVKKLNENNTTITLGWTIPPGQEGYIPLIDSQERLTDGKRHASVSESTSQVTIRKPTDGKEHEYGVRILGGIAEGNWSPITIPPIPPIPPTSGLGKELFRLFPEPAKPTGPVLKLSNFQELVNAWLNPTEGADYDGQGMTFSGPAGHHVCRIKGSKTTRFRNVKVIGGSRFLSAGSHIHLGNGIKEAFHVVGGIPDCFKIDPGSSWVSADGLILEGAERQGLLVASGTDIRIVNMITKNNGHMTNQDHGAYLSDIIHFLIANWLSHDNQGYNAQVYPQARDGFIVNATFDGGRTRGGAIYGSESSNSNPTRNVRTIGAISTNAPGSPGYDIYRTAPGCTVEDSMAFGNSGGGGMGSIIKDPKYFNRAGKDFRPQDPLEVSVANQVWLMPTDLYGNPRGAHAGALAKYA